MWLLPLLLNQLTLKQMEMQALTKQDCLDISKLLLDPVIYKHVIETDNVKGYKNYKISPEDCKILIGKYNWNSTFGGFWNELIKCKIEITFETFALRVWKALCELTKDNTSKEVARRKIGSDVLETAIEKRDYSKILFRFIEWYNYGINSHVATRIPVEKTTSVYIEHEPLVEVLDSVGCPFMIPKRLLSSYTRYV